MEGDARGQRAGQGGGETRGCGRIHDDGIAAQHVLHQRIAKGGGPGVERRGAAGPQVGIGVDRPAGIDGGGRVRPGIGAEDGDGAGEFPGQPDIVLVGEGGERGRQAAGMVKQAQEIRRRPARGRAIGCKKRDLPVGMGVAEGGEERGRAIGRPVVPDDERPVGMGLGEKAVELGGQVARPFQVAIRMRT